jgi:pimeloyl-ACP methyl ester carboxylesterase
MPGLLTPQRALARQVQINNSGHVLANYKDINTNPIQHYLRRITGIDTSTIIAASALSPFNDFSSIFDDSFAMNGDGEAVFVAQTGTNTPTLRSGERPIFSTLSPATGIFVAPAIDEFGDIAVRAGSSTSSPLLLYSYNFGTSTMIANTASGFTSIGQSPGISTYFADVIVFYGVLNQAGATAIGTNPGPGIFASIETDKKKTTRRIIRLTGRLIEDNNASGGNDDGICDAGETCIQGELGFNQAGNPIFFTGYDSISRIGVAHQSVGAPGIEDDIFVTSFWAVPNIASDRPERPFSNQEGIWTVTTQIKRIGGVLKEQVGVALPVIQYGDVVNGRTITQLGVYDPIASVRDTPSINDIPGGHRLAFYAGSNTGNMIIRASRENDVPVIFIPGVGGSSLSEKAGNVLTERYPGGFNPSNFERLSLAPGQTNNIVATDALRSVTILGFTEHVYDNLLEEFVTTAGLVEYQVGNDPEKRTLNGCDRAQGFNQPNLFVFAYDWRKSNGENAIALEEYVKCIQRFYPATKVDIVAHSMGGLLARRYIEAYPESHSVRKMISLGSPFLGAPKSVYVMETGDFFPLVANMYSGINLQMKTAKSVFKNLVPYLRGPQELLPSKAYFDLGGLPFSENTDFNGDGQLTTYNYQTMRDAFNSRYSTLPYEANHIFHQGGQDDWRQDSSGVEYHHIFGHQIEPQTPNQIVPIKKIVLQNSQPRFKFKIINDVGDGTVPVLSAERNENGINLNAQGVVPEAIFPEPNEAEDDDDVSHNGMLKNERVQAKIFSFLGLTEPSPRFVTKSGKKMKLTPSGINQRERNYLTIDGVDRLEITDDLGNTNTPLGNGLELKIPNVTHEASEYEGVQTHTVGLTTLRQYTVKFVTGTVTIDIDLVRGIGNASPNHLVRYVDLELPPNVECLLTINGQDMQDLRYDPNGDGTYDTVVPAHVRVTGTAAQDVTAPAVTLTYSKRTSSGRVITINALDTESGVQTIYYRVGETGSFKIYDGPFVMSVITEKVIEAFADDNVGNRSSPIRAVIPDFHTW